MNPKFVVIHRTDINNVGDMSSNPLRYFLKPEEYMVLDIDTLGGKPYPDDVPIIVGGGGLIGNEFFGENIALALEHPDAVQINNLWQHRWELVNLKYKDMHVEFHTKLKDMVNDALTKIDKHKTPKVIWGVGHNIQKFGQDDVPNLKYPKFMKDFNIVGIRDFVPHQPYEFVPCASCMDPSLNKTYPIKNDIVIIEHKKQLLKGAEFGALSIPRFVNSGDNLEQMIELIGSANIVISNSYHAIYWATLLKKKSICVGAWSSKFFTLKHKPHYIKSIGKELEEAIDEAKIYETALEESVMANRRMWDRVRALV
jgi:hypothetical protein